MWDEGEAAAEYAYKVAALASIAAESAATVAEAAVVGLQACGCHASA